ncbi:MAG: hypothetical protein ACI9FD_002768, partial [Gammaproteobacteria bacterium]
KPIRRYYDELGFSTDYMGLIKPVSNYFPRHESTPEKDFSDPLKILFVGRGCKEKRLHLLTKICLSTAKNDMPLHFDIVGDIGKWMPQSDLPNCTFHGFINDPSNFYINAHIILNTSSLEGFPLTIQEAMAFGVVPVCTNVGGLHQHVIDGKTGILVSAKPEHEIVETFVSSIEQLHHDRERLARLSNAAHTRAIIKSGYTSFVSSYRSLFSTGSIGVGYLEQPRQKPAVSFLMVIERSSAPCFDTILSLFQQSAESWQLVIIIDDTLMQQKSEFSIFKEDPRIVILSNSMRIGTAACQAKLISWADSEKLTFLKSGTELPAATVELIENSVSYKSDNSTSFSACNDQIGEEPFDDFIPFEITGLIIFSRHAYNNLNGFDLKLADIAFPYFLQKLITSESTRRIEQAISTHISWGQNKDFHRWSAARSLHYYQNLKLSAKNHSNQDYFRPIYCGLLHAIKVDSPSVNIFLSLLIKQSPCSFTPYRLAFGWWLFNKLGIGNAIHPLSNIVDSEFNDSHRILVTDPRFQFNTGKLDGLYIQCLPAEHSPGHCLFGPDFRIHESKQYQICFEIEFKSIPTQSLPVITLDVYDNRSDSVLVIRDFHPHEVTEGVGNYHLTCDTRSGQVLEFRAYWHGSSTISISSVTVIPHSS